MLKVATRTIPRATSGARTASLRASAATRTAPIPSTTVTPAAIRQSSPTMKSRQKRRNRAHQRTAMTRTAAQEKADQAARSRTTATSPLGHARLSPPSENHPSPSTAQKVPNVESSSPTANLIRVLRHVGERAVRGGADCEHDGAGHRGARGGQRDVVGVEPEGDDDEDDLQALEEDALEGHDEAEPVEAEVALGPGGPAGLELLAVDLVLVVESLQPRRAEDRLAQPLEPEDQQQRPDRRAAGATPGAIRPARSRPARRRPRGRRARPGCRRPPTASHA